MKFVKIIGILALFFFSNNAINAQLEWVPFMGEIPSNAVIGGWEHVTPLPICRCEFEGGMHPGKVVANMCNIGVQNERRGICIKY